MKNALLIGFRGKWITRTPSDTGATSSFVRLRLDVEQNPVVVPQVVAQRQGLLCSTAVDRQIEHEVSNRGPGGRGPKVLAYSHADLVDALHCVSLVFDPQRSRSQRAQLLQQRRLPCVDRVHGGLIQRGKTLWESLPPGSRPFHRLTGFRRDEDRQDEVTAQDPQEALEQ